MKVRVLVGGDSQEAELRSLDETERAGPMAHALIPCNAPP